MNTANDHVCRCQYCGRELRPPEIMFVPAPLPPPCEHEWMGLSSWQSTDSQDHGSRRCIKCHCYQSW